MSMLSIRLMTAARIGESPWSRWPERERQPLPDTCSQLRRGRRVADGQGQLRAIVKPLVGPPRAPITRGDDLDQASLGNTHTTKPCTAIERTPGAKPGCGRQRETHRRVLLPGRSGDAGRSLRQRALHCLTNNIIGDRGEETGSTGNPARQKPASVRWSTMTIRRSENW
jgi:hypothetical protein